MSPEQRSKGYLAFAKLLGKFVVLMVMPIYAAFVSGVCSRVQCTLIPPPLPWTPTEAERNKQSAPILDFPGTVEIPLQQVKGPQGMAGNLPFRITGYVEYALSGTGLLVISVTADIQHDVPNSDIQIFRPNPAVKVIKQIQLDDGFEYELPGGNPTRDVFVAEVLGVESKNFQPVSAHYLASGTISIPYGMSLNFGDGASIVR